MNTEHKVAGIAALALGGFFLLLVAVLMYLPSIGLGPGTLNDPKTGIAFIDGSVIPLAIALLYLAIGITAAVVLCALAGVTRGAQAILAHWTFVAACAAGTLFVGYAMSDIVALPYAAAAYHADPAVGGSAYVAIRAVGHGLSAGALFATGVGVMLSGIAGLGGLALPKVLSVLMIFAGLCAALSFLVLPLGLIGLLLAPVWSIWLGVVMLRRVANSIPVIDGARVLSSPKLRTRAVSAV
jgi:hypothetical protein